MAESEVPPPLLVVGPSGVGKSTFIGRLFEEFPDTFQFSISATCRPMRSGETDGVQYYFISKPDFEQRIEQQAFIEYATVHDNYYGTLKAEIQRIQKELKIGILDIDVQGAMQVFSSEFPCNSVFIFPPSIEEVEARLRGRGTETEAQIQTRITNAVKEVDAGQQYLQKFSGSVTNDDLETSYAQFRQLLMQLYPTLLNQPK